MFLFFLHVWEDGHRFIRSLILCCKVAMSDSLDFYQKNCGIPPEELNPQVALKNTGALK